MPENVTHRSRCLAVGKNENRIHELWRDETAGCWGVVGDLLGFRGERKGFLVVVVVVGWLEDFAGLVGRFGSWKRSPFFVKHKLR